MTPERRAARRPRRTDRHRQDRRSPSRSPRGWLARGIPAEVVSADSRQVYRGPGHRHRQGDARGAGTRRPPRDRPRRPGRGRTRLRTSAPTRSVLSRRLGSGEGSGSSRVGRVLAPRRVRGNRHRRAAVRRRRAGRARGRARADGRSRLPAGCAGARTVARRAHRPAQPAAGRPRPGDRRAPRRRAAAGARWGTGRRCSGSSWPSSPRSTGGGSRPGARRSSTPASSRRPRPSASASIPRCRPSRPSATARAGRTSTASARSRRRSSSTPSATTSSPAASGRGSGASLARSRRCHGGSAPVGRAAADDSRFVQARQSAIRCGQVTDRPTRRAAKEFPIPGTPSRTTVRYAFRPAAPVRREVERRR